MFTSRCKMSKIRLRRRTSCCLRESDGLTAMSAKRKKNSREIQYAPKVREKYTEADKVIDPAPSLVRGGFVVRCRLISSSIFNLMSSKKTFVFNCVLLGREEVWCRKCIANAHEKQDSYSDARQQNIQRTKIPYTRSQGYTKNGALQCCTRKPCMTMCFRWSKRTLRIGQQTCTKVQRKCNVCYLRKMSDLGSCPRNWERTTQPSARRSTSCSEAAVMYGGTFKPALTTKQQASVA